MILNRLYKHRRKLIGFFLAIVGLAILITIFSEHPVSAFILKFFDKWSIALGAAATVALAYVAAMSILENRRTREEDRKLNFRLSSLDEVRDWAREAVKLGFLYNRATNASEVLQVTNLIEEIAKTTDATNIAAQVFPNELTDSVNRALRALTADQDKTGKVGDKEYFDSFFELLKIIITLKKKLYYNK